MKFTPKHFNYLIGVRPVIKKILALICTGMPGAQRLFLFFLIEKVVNQKTFGLFSMDYSLVQMFSFFTAVSWCGVVVGRTPKLNEESKKIFLAKLLNSSFVCYLFFSLILVALHLLGFINFIAESLLFMLTWMLYQIFRHYHVAEKNYIQTLAGDSISILSFCILILLDVEPYFALGLSLIAAIIVLYTPSFAPRLLFIGDKEQKNAFEVGLFNFLLGLSSAALPFVVGYSGNIEYAGLFAYISTLIAILQLIPRAIGFNYIPSLAKAIDTERFEIIYKKYVFENHIAVALSAIGFICFGVILEEVNLVEVFRLDGALFIYTALTLCGALLALSLPCVNYFMVNEQTYNLRNIGAANSLLTMFALGTYYFSSNESSVFILVVNLAIIATIKLLYLYFSVKKGIIKQSKTI